jgi:hypothetical protein
MLGALAADALFCIAVLIETLAALSLLKAAKAITLREELEPMLAFYNLHIMPVLGFGANLLPVRVAGWYPDAAVIAIFIFFFFFIAQARAAMAPFASESGPSPKSDDVPTPVEAAVDAALPVAACAIGAFLCAPTLLPLLTPPVALWLLGRSLAGHPSWFVISRGYYVNALAVIAGVALILALPH